MVGFWVLVVDGFGGVRSFGRTVSTAAVNIREAIAEAEGLDRSEDLDLVFVIEDEGVSALLDRLREADRRRERASLDRRRAIEEAIQGLYTYGMSYRDIGSVIGLSQQRVAQIGSTGW
jgi:hypothetical protein